MGYNVFGMRLAREFLKRGYIFFLLSVLFLGASTMVKAEKMEDPNTPKKSIITVKLQDSGREVILKTGHIVQIELQTYGTAGYTWQFDELDKEHLEVVSSETKAMSDRMGAPTLCIWRLKAKKSGTARIAMSNYRVWEGREKAVGEFTLTVRIE